MNIFSYAHLDFEGMPLALVKATKNLLLDKNMNEQRKDAIDTYEKVFGDKTVVLYYEDKEGIKTVHCDDQSLASKLVSADLSKLEWQTYDMDK